MPVGGWEGPTPSRDQQSLMETACPAFEDPLPASLALAKAVTWAWGTLSFHCRGSKEREP